MPHGQALGSYHHCGACEDRYGPLRITVASVALCLALSCVVYAEFIAVRPGDELKLMKEAELQREVVSACQAFIEEKEKGDGAAMRKAARYVRRIALVVQARHDGHAPFWESALYTAMGEGNLAGCFVPTSGAAATN